jgi:hypothetical protein
MTDDLGVYFKLLWAKRTTTCLGGLATVLAIVNGVRGPTKQIVLPLKGWIYVAVGSLIIAQFLVWRDAFVADVESTHGEQLRRMAMQQRGRIAEPIALGDATAERMFTAHFPELRAATTRARELDAEAAQTKKTLYTRMLNDAVVRFPGEKGWWPHTVAQRTLDLLENWDGDGSVQAPLSRNAATLAWQADVIYWPEKATDGGCPEARRTLIGGPSRLVRSAWERDRR